MLACMFIQRLPPPRTLTRAARMDDPFMWAMLPIGHFFDPANIRFGLAAFDITFTSPTLARFFTLGQVLPTYRQRYSTLGGILQPTMTEAIRLLSAPPFGPDPDPSAHPHAALSSYPPSDPFSALHSHFYTTTGADAYPAPSTYPRRNRHAWLHVFPEGRVHQHPRRGMRYFRWGVARLILEADRCPDVVPMWIEGTDQILPEERGPPRWLPRAGKRVGVWIGKGVSGAEAEAGEGPGPEAKIFGDLRRRWRALVDRENLKTKQLSRGEEQGVSTRGILESDELKYGREAVQLRMDCALEIRKLVLGVRSARGLPDEDPKASWAATWREESGGQDGKMEDGSVVNDAA